MKKNNYLTIGMSVLVLVLLVTTVSASVSFKKVIEVTPGQTLEQSLRLMNSKPGDPDMRYMGIITGGEGIVSFKGDSDFTVPNGGVADAVIQIKAPDDASIGQVYTINMLFETEGISSVDDLGEGTSIGLNKNYAISFDVKVVEEVSTPDVVTSQVAGGLSTITIILIAVVVVLIVLVLFIVLRKKKQQTPINPPVSSTPAQKPTEKPLK